jgi:hypothetical protein
MKIWLDDQFDDPDLPERKPPEGYVGVHNFVEFRSILEEAIQKGEPIEAIDFDNDLGEGEMEGYKIFEWAAHTYPREVLHDEVILNVHSKNPVRAQHIREQIETLRQNREELIAMKERPDPWAEEVRVQH